MKKCSIFTILLFLVSIQLFAQTNNDYFSKNTIQLDDGSQLDQIIISGPPEPPSGYKHEIAYPTDTSVILSDVPAFDWSFGCSATSAAMHAGYYDRTGYPYMYAGPGGTPAGVMPLDNSEWSDWWDGTAWRHQCPLSATHNLLDGRVTDGHVDDYWISYGSSGPDPWIAGGIEHTYGDCTGDYMKTNQWAYGNTDGSTTFWNYNDGSPLYYYQLESFGPGYYDHDGGYGLKLFYESRGYTVTNMYNQHRQGYGTNPALGFTYIQYKAEIDAGRPVVIHVEGHTMLGYGYDDTSSNLMYIHDTWDYNSHTMIWGGSYSTMVHTGVTIVTIEPVQTVSTPTFSPPAGIYGTTQNVTISCTTPGTTIYYTADGSDPTILSNLYSTPVSVSSSGTLKARAFHTLWDPSSISVAVYVLNISHGSGNNGGGTGPAVVDMPLTNIDGTSVDPDVSIDPAGTLPITVNVTVTDEVQSSTPVPYPDNVIISYDVDVIGTITGVNLALDLSFSGLTGLDQIHWLNGTNWEVPSGISWSTPGHVTFNLTLSDRDASTEIILSEDDPLPVTLSTFTAEYSSSYPTLYWETASESDNMGWNVYRAISSNLGQASILNINTISGNGTTSEPSYYSFVDEYEVQDNFTYWYWLESIAVSGETEMFGPVALTIPLGNNDIQEIPMTTELHQNFPNPFNPNTSISFDIKEGETGVLSIYNIKGQLIVTKEFETGSHSYTWDASDQASGIYLYKLHTDSYSKMIKMLLVK